jgi:hypothetical protein
LGFAPGETLRAYSDVLVVRYATSDGIMLSNAPGTGDFTIPAAYGSMYAVNDTLMVNNCYRAEIFTVTAKTTAGATTTIKHTPLSNSYGAGTELMSFTTFVYYVAPTTRRDSQGNFIPALFRKKLASTGVGATTSEELVEGIDVMKVFYGWRSDNDPSKSPDRYVPADVVNAANAWSTVKSVRIGVVASTTETVGQTQDNVGNLDVVGLSGNTLDDYDPMNDGRQRRVFSIIVNKRQPARPPGT